MPEKVLTFDEVAQHNKLGDCWLIISGKVYDVSQFLEDHPGGDNVLLASTGKDATTDFEDVGHSSDAIMKSEEFVIGHIDESTIPKDDPQDMSPKPFSSPNKTSNNIWLYVLPILIVGIALFLRFYSKKNEELSLNK